MRLIPHLHLGHVRRRSFMACVWLLVVTLALAGCATPDSITAQVSTHGQWPAGSTLKHYAFERLPSQAAQADWQKRVEAAAAPALAKKGFVFSPIANLADVWVQVVAQSRTTPAYRDDPYPRFDTSVFGGVFGGHGGVGLGLRFDPEYTLMQVDVLLRERRTGQVLYETRATYERVGGMDEQLLPALFEAALQDFPTPAVSPRPVTVKRVP